MKRFTGWLLTCALLFTGITAFALPSAIESPEADLKFKSEAIDYRIVKILLINLQQETTTVKLADMQGKEYYRRVIRDHNGFARKLDLKGLDNGRYLLSVEQNGEEWIQVVLVDDQGVMLSDIVKRA